MAKTKKPSGSTGMQRTTEKLNVYDECDDYWLFVIFFIVIVYDECDVVHDGDYDDSLQGKTRNYCDHNNVGFKF